MFGKKLPVPRLSAWYGDPGSVYSYSNIRLDPKPWFAALTDVRVKVETLSGSTFNSVLLNLYRNGNDSMGWHSDDEPELGARPTIASLSLGATRKFHLRRRDDHKVRRSLDLHHGDLVVMAGPTQAKWAHHVPKTAKPVGVRLNLTFRTIHSTQGEPTAL